MPNKTKFKKITKTVAKKGTVSTKTASSRQEASMGRALLRALGGLGGGAAGLFTGNPAGGASYGYGLGNAAATILGLGSYSVKSNSLYNNAIKTGQVPNMHNEGQSIIVRHKEYIGDVISSGTAGVFSSVSYPINPGLPGTFPWLSGIADQFQEYTFKGLLFEYKSASADAIASSTNTALGTVIMTTRYNPVLPAPVGKIDALNEYFTSDAKPSEDFCHFIECDLRENPFNVLYTRSEPPPSNANIQNYDLGELYVCTQGMQGTNNVCGELWASYEVELRKPIITDDLTLASGGQFSSYATAGISTSNYFGTSQVASTQQFQGCSVQLNASSLVINGNYEGAFMIMYYVKGSSSSTWVQPTFSSGLNCAAYNGFENGAVNNLVNPVTGSTVYISMACWTFQYANTSAVNNVISVNIAGGTFVSANTMEVWVIPISNVST
jgi:hypothetical protein